MKYFVLIFLSINGGLTAKYVVTLPCNKMRHTEFIYKKNFSLTHKIELIE